ncbi:3'(2'),5'-bisphosphate nucleotidase CysQ [Paenochrobactrum sp. BZR 588]|uniref:3'(2'),5'-bisphosphate nucleotidase CysQ n=1 Tax=unclassified Paenochrobactrum TaxID=2639760 RepID=UPI0038540659
MNEMTSALLNEVLLLQELELAALEAGREIMRIYAAGCDVSQKDDQSPVTEADQLAEKLILKRLRAFAPDIPIVAEEEMAAGLSPQELGARFFLVDPLDGTKEFVKRNGDFTVNIALIENGVPVLGVVYAPVGGRLYIGGSNGAVKVLVDDAGQELSRTAIHVRQAPEQITAVASRSHNTPETDACLQNYGIETCVSVGSSLKFCLVAEGQADLYPRYSRTMEWDTAAGDAVLRAAGGLSTTLDGKPMLYGKRGQVYDCDFANGFFIARGCASLDKTQQPND